MFLKELHVRRGRKTELVALGARGVHSCLLDANNFRLLKIVKHNFNTSGKITGFDCLLIICLGSGLHEIAGECSY